MFAKGKSAKEIAEGLKVSISTVYRWINDKNMEFEKSKALAEFKASDMASVIDESHKKLLMEIAEDPERLLEPKVADSLCKVAKVLESLQIKADREKIEEAEGEPEIRGVLIIDDIEYQALRKKAEEAEREN